VPPTRCRTGCTSACRPSVTPTWPTGDASMQGQTPALREQGTPSTACSARSEVAFMARAASAKRISSWVLCIS